MNIGGTRATDPQAGIGRAPGDAATRAQNLTFGASNAIESASELTASPPPATPLAWLRGTARARRVRWVNPVGSVLTIAGRIGVGTEGALVDHCALLPAEPLSPGARVRLELYGGSAAGADAPLYDSGHLAVASPRPAGLFVAGVDPFGQPYAAASRATEPDAFVHRFVPIAHARRFVLHIEHALDYTPPPPPDAPPPPPTVTVSDGIRRQNEASGVLAIEAESAVMESGGGESYVDAADAAAGGGSYRERTGTAFHGTFSAGPRLLFDFTATRSGAHALWVRLRSTRGNSIWSAFDAETRPNVFPVGEVVNAGWVWREVLQPNLAAGTVHRIVIAARDDNIDIDRIVLQPAGASAPAGVGPPESGFGTREVASDAPPPSPPAPGTAALDLPRVDLRSLLIGHSLTLTENFLHGSSFRYVAAPDIARTAAGYAIGGSPRARVRAATLDLSVLTDADRMALAELERTRGDRPILCSLYPARGGWWAERHAFVARLVRPLDFAHTYDRVHATTLELLEA